MKHMSFPHRIWRDFSLALTFFTRIPLPVPKSAFDIKLADAAWAFPVVGLIVGLIAAGAAETLSHFGAPSVISAGVALILMVLVTGALHEDGLADTADGLGGGHTVERKLEIMRDSSTGVYGVIAVVMSLLLRFLFIQMIIEAGNLSLLVILPWVTMLSRTTIVGAMSHVGQTQAGGKGLGQSAGQASWIVAALWAGLTIGLMANAFMLVALFGFFSGLIAAWYFRRKIGGMTGDGYGFVEQVTQIAGLAAFSWVAV